MNRIAIAWTYIGGQNYKKEIVKGYDESCLDDLVKAAYKQGQENAFFANYRSKVEIGLPLGVALNEYDTKSRSIILGCSKIYVNKATKSNA